MKKRARMPRVVTPDGGWEGAEGRQQPPGLLQGKQSQKKTKTEMSLS